MSSMRSSLPEVLFLDACVLYPAQTRDLFMRLALAGLVRLKWTARVQEEWIENLLRKNLHLSPEQKERLKKIPQVMEKHLEFQAPLVTGYEGLMERVELKDPDDHHVVAAAFWGGAEAILTFNIKDFPQEALEPWELVALHPDDYLVDLAGALIEGNFLPEPLLEVLAEQRLQLKNPPLTVDGFLHQLRRVGLENFAALLAAYRGHLQ